MSEAATRRQRGYFSSFQYVTLVGGHVRAQFTLLVILAVFTREQVHEFGWRIGCRRRWRRDRGVFCCTMENRSVRNA